MLPSDELATRFAALPLDRPFTSAEVADYGVPRRQFRLLISAGLVRVLVKGVYAVADLELDVLTRARAIALVIPPNSVATDETAAWIHGVDLLDHRGGPPQLTFVRIHGDTRLRREGLQSGTRMFVAKDLMMIEGVVLTTPLRTALDLGRRLRPDRALGALDGLLRTGAFTTDDLKRQLPRFRGFRGVVLLRELIPIADARAESPPESKLRYEWLLAADLPKPEPQIEILSPFSGLPWRMDLGVGALRYAVEYDGKDFHSSDQQRERDRVKREYVRNELGWTVDVLEQADLYGPLAEPIRIIRAGIKAARLGLGTPVPTWRWPRM
jgi:hypothetical protein